MHESRLDEVGASIYASNITDKPISFIRFEVSYLKPAATSGGWIVQPYRRNVLCACGEVCEVQSNSIAPWGSTEFIWDLKSDDCEQAKPGRYKVQLVNACEYEGCLGSYRIGAGEDFNVH